MSQVIAKVALHLSIPRSRDFIPGTSVSTEEACSALRCSRPRTGFKVVWRMGGRLPRRTPFPKWKRWRFRNALQTATSLTFETASNLRGNAFGSGPVIAVTPKGFGVRRIGSRGIALRYPAVAGPPTRAFALMPFSSPGVCIDILRLARQLDWLMSFLWFRRRRARARLTRALPGAAC